MSWLPLHQSPLYPSVSIPLSLYLSLWFSFSVAFLAWHANAFAMPKHMKESSWWMTKISIGDTATGCSSGVRAGWPLIIECSSPWLLLPMWFHVFKENTNCSQWAGPVQKNLLYEFNRELWKVKIKVVILKISVLVGLATPLVTVFPSHIIDATAVWKINSSTAQAAR